MKIDLKKYVLENAIAIQDLTKLPIALLQVISNYKIVLLSDLHGTNESPEAALGLISLLSNLKKPISLALEIPKTAQKDIDTFIDGGNLELLKNSHFFKNQYQFGTASIAIGRLLQQVRMIPNLRVFCFDSDSPKRDLTMACNIIKEFQPEGYLVILTGSSHIWRENEKDKNSMSYYLWSLENSTILENDIFSIGMCAETIHCFATSRLEGTEEIVYGEQKFGGIAEFLLFPHPPALGKYFILLPPELNSYNAILFTRITTPSPPLINS